MRAVEIDRLLKCLREGKSSRRDFLRLCAIAGVSVGSAKVSRKAWAADEQPLFFTWASMDVPEFFPSYVAKHGQPPRFAVFGDQEEALTKVRSGFKADIVYPQSYTIRRWWDAGTLEPVDTSKLSNWNDILPDLRNADGVTVDGNVIWVPSDWGMSSITVRTDLAPEYAEKDTWDILWDKTYSGRLSMLDSMADAVGAAAIHTGVDAYNMSDDDIAKVRAALAEQRPLLRFYSADPTSIGQALASGELVAANTWNDVYTQLKSQNLPVRYMKPKEGTMAWVGGLSLVKGTNNRELAHEVIDSYLEPKARAFGMSNYGYISATAGGFKAADEETLKRLDLPRDPTELMKNSIIQKPMAKQDEIQRMFEDVKQGL